MRPHPDEPSAPLARRRQPASPSRSCSRIGSATLCRADNPSRRILVAAIETLHGALHRAPSLRPQGCPRLVGDRAGVENGHRRAGNVNHRPSFPPVLSGESYRPRRPHILRAGACADRLPHLPRHGRIVAASPVRTMRRRRGRPCGPSLPPDNRRQLALGRRQRPILLPTCSPCVLRSGRSNRGRDRNSTLLG
jgi:hypothetical protein